MRERKGCLKIYVFNFQIFYTCQGTQYTGTGKCKYWKYVVESELSKQMYVEDIEIEEITLKR